MPLLETIGSSAALAYGLNVTSSSGAFESILTVTPSGVSQVNITIPTGYQHLQIRAHTLTSSIFSGTSIYFNADTTDANYWSVVLDSYGTSPLGRTWSGAASYLQWASGGSSPYAANSITDIFDYSSSTKTTTTRTMMGAEGSDGSGYSSYIQSLWKNTAPVTTIRIIGPTFSAGTTIALYGVKG